MAIDLAWCTKNSRNKSIVALCITLLFSLLHMMLWLCIYYRLGALDLEPVILAHNKEAQTSHAILKLTILCIGLDLVCLTITTMAMIGVQKDFQGRQYLYAWMFGMILYIFVESLISWSFIYWCHQRNMILFVLISSIIFWVGRTVILIGCMIQVSSHFGKITETNVPTIIVQESAPFAGHHEPGARKRRTPSVATVSTIVSNMSNPDELCEKQYPGYLPCSVDFDTMYPAYLFDDYDPSLYPPDFGYDYYQYNEYPQNLVSPSYEEATSSAVNNPPPYSTGDNMTPPVYSEADHNLVVSAQAIDSTPDAGLIYGTRK